MKKILSIILAAVMIFLLPAVCTAAEQERVLRFNEDGSFKIMQINDTQDVGKLANGKLVKFIEAAVDKENPDLVVVVGDQLADFFPFGGKEDMLRAIDNIIAPLEERGIPFLVTLGNHDHDHLEKFSKSEQFEAYASYDNCYMPADGWDEFTVNVPVLFSDSDNAAMSIFMMNTHDKTESGGYSGVVEGQNIWFRQVSAELKEANSGQPLPSILFQHIPPKEIYQFVEECEYNDEGAIYSDSDKKWYRLDESRASGVMGELPCSEDADHITGQYESWLETDNIIGAFFGHDHVNSFVGTTDEGIVMGYNAGTGFRAYGSGGDRSVRIFEFNENNVEDYTTRILTYEQATESRLVFSLVDIFSPAFSSGPMRVIYFLFGWLISR